MPEYDNDTITQLGRNSVHQRLPVLTDLIAL